MSFVIYKSSAGSGKTFTLVKDYLKLILKDPQKYYNILAVTFTNKAAGEMKERIINNLISLNNNESTDMINLLKNELNIEEKRLKINAKKSLDNLLHNYSDFAIMTIDSFIYKVVRSFAIELDLPLNFDVDMNINMLTEKVVSNMVDSATNKNHGKFLLKHALTKINNKKSWDFEFDLINVGQELFKEKNLNNIDLLRKLDIKFFNKLINIIIEDIQKFKNFVRNKAKKALKIIENNNLKIKDFSYGKRGIAGNFKKLSTATKIKDFELGKRFKKGEKWVAKSKKPKKLKHKIENLVENELDNIRKQIIAFINDNWEDFVSKDRKSVV